MKSEILSPRMTFFTKKICRPRFGTAGPGWRGMENAAGCGYTALQGDRGRACGGMWAYRPTGVMEAGHAADVGIPEYGGRRPDMRRVWAYRTTGDGGRTCGGMWASRPTGGMEAKHAAGVGIPEYGGRRPDMRRVWAFRPSGDGGQTCGGCGHTGVRSVRGMAWGRQGVSA